MPNLPPELVAHILSFVMLPEEDDDLDQQDREERVGRDALAACCLASKSFHALGQEKLYRSLSFTFVDVDKSEEEEEEDEQELSVTTTVDAAAAGGGEFALGLSGPSAHNTLNAGVGGQHTKTLALHVDITNSLISPTILQQAYVLAIGRLFDLCPNLSALVVSQGYDWQLGGILGADLSSFEQIREFTLCDTEYMPSRKPAALRRLIRVLRAMPRLEHLRFSTWGIVFVLSGPGGLPSQLRTLAMGEATQTMLDYVAFSSHSTLTSLVITLPLEEVLNLSMFHNLTEVTITSSPPRSDPPAVDRSFRSLPAPCWTPPSPSYIRHLTLSNVSIFYALPSIPTTLQRLSLSLTSDTLSAPFQPRAYPPPHFFECLITLVRDSTYLQSFDMELVDSGEDFEEDVLEEHTYPAALRARVKAACEEKGVILEDKIAALMDEPDAASASAEGSDGGVQVAGSTVDGLTEASA